MHGFVCGYCASKGHNWHKRDEKQNSNSNASEGSALLSTWINLFRFLNYFVFVIDRKFGGGFFTLCCQPW